MTMLVLNYRTLKYIETLVFLVGFEQVEYNGIKEETVIDTFIFADVLLLNSGSRSSSFSVFCSNMYLVMG